MEHLWLLFDFLIFISPLTKVEIAYALRKTGEWGRKLYTGLLTGSNMKCEHYGCSSIKVYFECLTFIRVSRACYLRHLLQHLYYEHRIDYKKTALTCRIEPQKILTSCRRQKVVQLKKKSRLSFW